MDNSKINAEVKNFNKQGLTKTKTNEQLYKPTKEGRYLVTVFFYYQEIK